MWKKNKISYSYSYICFGILDITIELANGNLDSKERMSQVYSIIKGKFLFEHLKMLLNLPIEFCKFASRK